MYSSDFLSGKPEFPCIINDRSSAVQVLQFTEFHPNVGKIFDEDFTLSVLKVLKKAIAQTCIGKTLKIHENLKGFVLQKICLLNTLLSSLVAKKSC